MQRSASLAMLGVDAGFGMAGISALGALRFFTGSITPKRVRVVTDIDDTVKSSGNKRLFGIPLGGIDAQCEFRVPSLGCLLCCGSAVSCVHVYSYVSAVELR